MTRALLFAAACMISAPCLAHTAEVSVHIQNKGPAAWNRPVSIARGDLDALCQSWRQSGRDHLLPPNSHFKFVVGPITWTAQDENARRARINQACKPA